ncbi:MAG TPA: PIN domain-containing protein [Verrucomicrobiota bacterium]|nr:PIN domain-containing protein [Verrucomicrobiota bacterium]
MTFILDTNVVSEINKESPDPVCMGWLSAHANDCAISTITVSELRYGIERMTDGKKKTELQRDYNFLLEDYEGRFFEFDGPSAAEWGRYAAELEGAYGSDWWKHYDLRDTQIAAIAREYGLTVATRNSKDFPFVDVVNPFK